MKTFQFKRLFATLLMVVLPSSLHVLSAQTFHAIIFADTTDPSIGEGDKNDFINMSMEFSTIAAATGMQLKTYYYKDERCSHDNLVELLSTMQTKPEDIIFFYYSGHGTRSSNDDSDFPQMCLASRYDSHFYPLEKTLAKLASLPSRLRIVLGDCCNSVVEGVTPKDYASKGVTVLTKEPVNAYRSLFCNLRGNVIASGSQRGEASLTMTFGGRPRGVFTKNFLDVLQEVAKDGLDVAWDDIMRNTQKKTQEMTRDYGEHTPVYVVKINEGTEEEEVKNDEAPQNTTVITDAQQEELGSQSATVQEASSTASNQDSETNTQPAPQAVDNTPSAVEVFTYIANEKCDIDKRIALMPKALKAYFSTPSAKVEVVGRNGITIVATEKAEDFLLRLSTSHRLINIAEVDSNTDADGKYTYLKVHEIYSGY